MNNIVRKIIQGASRLALLGLVMMGMVAYAAWSEPGVTPGTWPVGKTVADYQLNHVLVDPQHKNYAAQSDFTFSVGSGPEVFEAGGAVGPVGGGGGGSPSSSSAFSPFLALVSGNFKQLTQNNDGYVFSEATYVEGMKLLPGNIEANTRSSNPGYNPLITVLIPGFIRADRSAAPDDDCQDASKPCDVVLLEGGTNPLLPVGNVSNDMVNIFLKDPSTEPGVSGATMTTNRFGIEKSGSFASLRMGQVYVDKAFVGGRVNTGASLTAPMNPGILNNFIGNFTSLPDPVNLQKPEVLQGGLSYVDAGVNPTTTKFSNIGHGDYCYLQNPQIGAICPDGFFLSKYDGVKEAVCRSFNPSPDTEVAKPTLPNKAVTVKADFRKNMNLQTDVNNHILYGVDECKSAPPEWACNDGVDNDGDNQIDYPDDAGCQDAFDMSEYNFIPPPPVNNPYVTTRLLGPYLGESCNIGDNTIGAWNSAAEDFITYIDTAPYGISPLTPLTPLTSGKYAALEYSQYWRSGSGGIGANKIPQKYDVVVAGGHYRYNVFGGGNWQKRGPLLPGWYFVHGQITPLYKIKVGASNVILDVNECII